MGCGPSQNVDDFAQNDLKRKNTVVVKPKASVSVGQGIGQNINHDALQIVFIFGGPGCGKGSIVHNLINTFNFKFISAELYILQNVAKHLNAEDATTSDLQKLIKENSFELTLEWVLSIIEDEIRKDFEHPVLIDVMPNLKFLSKKDALVKDCNEDMENFEKKFPISFAINLSVKKDQLINKTHKSHAAVKSQKKEDAQNHRNSQKNGPSDEVDTSRTYRRFQKYEDSVRDFINYFRLSDRLLTVDTSSGRNDIVWESIKDYFVDSEFVPMLKPVELVILFCFEHEDVQKIDLHRYPMKEIQIHDLVENAQERNLLNILIELGKFLKIQGNDEKYFIINLEGIDINLGELSRASRKALMFEEIAIGQLDYFIHKLRRKSRRRISQARKAQQMYKAILSTDNETLLFPSHVSSELCHQVSLFLTDCREQAD